jgi:hypothetical protein
MLERQEQAWGIDQKNESCKEKPDAVKQDQESEWKHAEKPKTRTPECKV